MTPARRKRGGTRRRGPRLHIGRAPQQLRLYRTQDHGRPVAIPIGALGGQPNRHGTGWEPVLQSFLQLNARAFEALDLAARLAAAIDGPRVELQPHGTAGAVPLISPITGRVDGGLLVEPRFGWAGVGPVLQETGWAASPDFLDLPLVPGSGREVPPWVLAGPVLARLAQLLDDLRPGYEYHEERRQSPRGTILWSAYARECLPTGRWHQLPCRYPDLHTDPQLRQALRWTLERIHRDLSVEGGTDQLSLALAHLALSLLDRLRDAAPVMPTRHQLERQWTRDPLAGKALRQGVQAMAWIVDERGLGGGRQLDGLAWRLPLEELWEHYVEARYRQETAINGGEVHCGRLGQTTIPIQWSDPMHRSLGHLVPDLVVRRGRHVQVVDAKYKAHFAELDVTGWYAMIDDLRAAHRADVHQVLAYAGLMDAEEITATLVYPLRRSTWAALASRGRDRSVATVYAGERSVKLELQGLPFGRSPNCPVQASATMTIGL